MFMYVVCGSYSFCYQNGTQCELFLFSVTVALELLYLFFDYTTTDTGIFIVNATLFSGNSCSSELEILTVSLWNKIQNYSEPILFYTREYAYGIMHKPSTLLPPSALHSITLL